MNIGDLELGRNRAVARSGSVDWADPFVGARLRYAVSPGHEIFVRGDVGGFGVGSRFSWQAIAGYGFDFAVRNGITVSGVLDYKALYVDYAEGEGGRRYEFDMLQHGPVLGVSMRFQDSPTSEANVGFGSQFPSSLECAYFVNRIEQPAPAS